MICEGLEFTPMRREDIPVLTPIMKRAFDDDSRLFFGRPTGGPPGYDDGSFLAKWGIESGARTFRIDRGKTPLGGMILFVDEKNRRGFLGCLFIDADRIGNGFGAIAWHFAERSFPEVEVWETETPAVSYRNHRFYVNKCGFQVYAVEGGMDRYQAQFKLRKHMKG